MNDIKMGEILLKTLLLINIFVYSTTLSQLLNRINIGWVPSTVLKLSQESQVIL